MLTDVFQTFKYHILLHLIIFIWGFTGILGKLIEMDSLHIVWWRVVIAALGLFLYLKYKKWDFSVPNKKILGAILLVGLIVGAHWMTFFYAIQLSTASLGILCLSTTTLHVTWLEPLIMKRRFLPLEFILGLIIIGALAYVSGDFNSNDYLALGIGLLSAFFAALFAVSNAKLVQFVPSSTITLYEMTSAILVVTVICYFDHSLNSTMFEMSWMDFFWLLFLGLICTSFAFLVVVDLVNRLGAFTVSLSVNLEPIYTILLAIVILNENQLLSNRFYVGSVIIVAVVVTNALIKYQVKNRALRKLH